MEKLKNGLLRIWKSIKNLFVFLFGFGKHKEKNILKEEELMSPGKQILKKFLHNRLAIIGLSIFIIVVLFVSIGSATMDFEATQKEASQIALQPGRNYLNIPSGLKKTGVKAIVDEQGNKKYLVGNGVAFSVAIGNNNKIYVWGANVSDIKKVPKEVQEQAKDIVQISVGSSHVVALTKDGKFVAWGKNNFEQASTPVYDPDLDQTFGEHKKAIQYYFDSSVRGIYASDGITTIEEDPIKKVQAGYEYTSILTKSGVVFTWGSTKSTGLSEPHSSYIYTKPTLIADNTKREFRWKYASSTTETFLMTYDELIAKENLEVRAGDPIEFRRNSTTNKIQWKYASEASKDYKNLIDAADLLVGIDLLKIVDIQAYDFNIVYTFDDGAMSIVGLDGTAKQMPNILKESDDVKGYSVKQIALTKNNGFALTSEGKIISWGEINGQNLITEIPAEVNRVKIVQIATGTHHIVALDESGKVYTWGYNNTLGQLNMPKNLSGMKYITSNYFNSLSINENGKVTIWGNKGYFFGTDLNGADIFSRVINGGKITLTSAAVAVLVSLVIGLIVGLVSGFYGGWIDNVLMRLGEIVNSFPFLPLAMTLAVIVQENDSVSENARIYMIMVILGFLSWPGLARLVRGQILAEREKDFVMAAKALGIKEKHIITRHILPNVINVVIVSTTLSYAGTLLTEAGLSYLGFGVKLPNPSWGNLLTSAQKVEVLKQYWWMWIIPAFFLIMTALSINLVGDGLRDAMDPKSNER